MKNEEINKAVKNNLDGLLGQLYSTFPQYLPPKLDKAAPISLNKLNIITHYSDSWKNSHDMTKMENMMGYFNFKNSVIKFVEEFLPETMWADIERKHKVISKDFEKRLDKYLSNPDLLKAGEEFNPFDEKSFSVDPDTDFPNFHWDFNQTVESI
jgi:hypothetical protein